MTEPEFIYAASDVYKRLGVKDSTLRKYVEMLQRVDYSIEKDNQGRRMYKEHDVVVLEKLVEISKRDGMSLEKAAKFIVQQLSGVKDKNKNETEEVISFNAQPYDGILKLMMDEQKKNMTEMEERLFKRIDQQGTKLIEKINMSDELKERKEKTRDQVLMETFRAQQENKKLLLEVRELIEAEKEIAVTNSQKKQWWKFWL